MSTGKTPLQSRIEKLVRPDIRALSAYHVPDASGMLKLDAMENPYQWPEQLRQQWLARLADAPLNRYPLPDAPGVIKALRQAMQLPDRFGLLLGNGSDEIIQMLIAAVAQTDAIVMAPDPSFVMYRMISQFMRVRFQPLPLNPDFSLDKTRTLQYVTDNQPALIFFAQPNNPTGNRFDEDIIRAVCAESDGLVVIDEAYTPFTEGDALPLLDAFDNLVVMRTLSKVGLAGLRLGFLVGHPDWITEFDKVRLPYNIDILTQLSAEFALEHYDWFLEKAEAIKQAREALAQALSSLDGLEVFPSEANFLLVRTRHQSAEQVFDGLKAQQVLVKKLHGSHPLLENCLRITVSTPEENRQLLDALKPLL